MNNIAHKFARIAVASALATGILSAGLAASALTPSTSAAANATTVSMSMTGVDAKAKHQRDLEQANADARRVEFRNQGTSL